MRPVRERARRTFAAVLATTVLFATLPAAAYADNIWALWWEGIKQRHPVEIPIVGLITAPAMLIITPLWASGMAIGAIQGDGSDD